MPLDTPVDTLNFLSDDSVPETETPKEEVLDLPIKEEEEKEEEVSEEETSEEDNQEEEDKEEQPEEELDQFVGPISRKEILAKYPKIFKEFPGLEAAYYREQKYASVFPTVDDAKQAQERSETLTRFEQAIGQGDFGTVLTAVKQSDAKAFGKIVDNYLVDLQKVDQNAYTHILGNIFSNAVATMFNEGKRINNEELQKAAAILNQFVFGTADYKAPSKFTKEDNKEETELAKERRSFQQQQFETARNSVMSRTSNMVTSTISHNIDPKGQMSDYVKRTAIRDCQELLDNTMAQDTRFRAVIDKLWERAFNSNFSQASQDAIRNAYLSKAKTILPQLLSKVRGEAIKGLKVTNRPEKDRKGPLPMGRSAPQSKGGSVRDKAKALPGNKSSLDYLMED